MRTQPDLGRVVDVLTEVAEQRRVLEEARAIWQQLSYGLSQQSARELFPGFSDAWLKSLEIENRLLDADGIYLDLQRAALAGRLAGKDKANAEELYRKRAALEKRLATAPRTVGAYRARSKTVTVRLHQIAKDIDEDILHIRKIQEQLVAMQKLLKEVKYKGSTMLQVKDEDQLLKELEAEAAALDALLQEAEAMRAQVEQEMLISEVADPMGQSERDVKTELWQAHREEAAFYAGKGTGLDAAGTRLFETASARRREIYTMLESVADLQEQIDQKAARQIAVYQKVLDEEKLALDARERELNATEQDAMVFARGVGSVLFYKAKESLVKAVIEAELGLVDLAWEQEEEQRREVQQVVLEKTELINRLNAELNEIQPPGGREEQ